MDQGKSGGFLGLVEGHIAPNEEELFDGDDASFAIRRGPSIISRRSGGGHILMKFETGDMFGSPSNRMQHAHNDAVTLAQEDATSASDNRVLVLLWQDLYTCCGTSVGALGKFCITVNCGVVAHMRANKVPKVGYWYVPISARSTWVLSTPTVQDNLISQDARETQTQEES